MQKEMGLDSESKPHIMHILGDKAMRSLCF